MDHVWNYGGAEYLFDVSESENMGRMCRGLEALRGDIGGLAGETAEDALREQCCIIRRFFDAVLGDGTGVKVCGEAYSADAHTTAYVEFILFVNEQVNRFRTKMEAVEEKYRGRAAQMTQAYGV
ncbi:MAG: DUF6673 family protein [Eubacteriales bacterium]